MIISLIKHKMLESVNSQKVPCSSLLHTVEAYENEKIQSSYGS